MSFRRVWVGGAAVAFGFAGACGITSNLTLIEGADSGTDGDAVDARVSDARVDAQASDASPDAPYDGPGCANDPAPTSDDCTIVRPCESGECAAKDSVVYECRSSDGGTRPKIDGCNLLGSDGGAYEWCCPATCIVSKEPGCAAAALVACPNFLTGPRVQPPVGCLSKGTGSGYALYCCP